MHRSKFLRRTLVARYTLERLCKVTRRLTAIDLFSGCGGLSLGLKKAGFRVIAAIDNDALANETYLANHPETLLLQTDITKVSANKLMQTLGLEHGELDLLAGCPPCQGFSTLRTLNGQRRIKDPMNDLVFQFLRFIRVLHPKTIMMENVPGLAKDQRFTKFCKTLTKLGYQWKHSVRDAADFGIPQRRRRLILLAALQEPIPCASKLRSSRTVRHAIANLEKAGESGDPLHDHPAQRRRNACIAGRYDLLSVRAATRRSAQCVEIAGRTWHASKLSPYRRGQPLQPLPSKSTRAIYWRLSD